MANLTCLVEKMHFVPASWLHDIPSSTSLMSLGESQHGCCVQLTRQTRFHIFQMFQFYQQYREVTTDNRSSPLSLIVAGRAHLWCKRTKTCSFIRSAVERADVFWKPGLLRNVHPRMSVCFFNDNFWGHPSGLWCMTWIQKPRWFGGCRNKSWASSIRPQDLGMLKSSNKMWPPTNGHKHRDFQNFQFMITQLELTELRFVLKILWHTINISVWQYSFLFAALSTDFFSL